MTGSPLNMTNQRQRNTQALCIWGYFAGFASRAAQWIARTVRVTIKLADSFLIFNWDNGIPHTSILKTKGGEGIRRSHNDREQFKMKFDLTKLLNPVRDSLPYSLSDSDVTRQEQLIRNLTLTFLRL